MIIFRDMDSVSVDGGCAVTVGTFDGFHAGHQVILDRTRSCARERNLQTAVVTFHPHPRKVLAQGAENLHILTTVGERIAIFEAAGVDVVVVIPFTRQFAATDSADFVRDFLVARLGMKAMVVGHDHHFGRNREGSFEVLKASGDQLGFQVTQVSPQEIEGRVVSSTRIRQLVSEGNVAEAAVLMGRAYRLRATVVAGSGRGRIIGFPTANLRPDDGGKLLPQRGVYAVDVQVKDRLFNGMMNIGTRPTFEDDDLTLEVHIFNFNASLYGEEIEIHFKQFLRPEKRFDGPDALIKQLEIDKEICERL